MRSAPVGATLKVSNASATANSNDDLALLFPAADVLAISTDGWGDVLYTIAPFFSSSEMERIVRRRHDLMTTVCQEGSTVDPSHDTSESDSCALLHDHDVDDSENADDHLARLDGVGSVAAGRLGGSVGHALRRSYRHHAQKTSYRHSNKLNRRACPPDAGELADMRATYAALGEPGTARARESIRRLETWLAKAPPGEHANRSRTSPSVYASCGLTSEEVQRGVETRVEMLLSGASTQRPYSVLACRAVVVSNRHSPIRLKPTVV